MSRMTEELIPWMLQFASVKTWMNTIVKDSQMAQKQPIKPAPYLPTDTPETEAVDIFKNLVDHSKVNMEKQLRPN